MMATDSGGTLTTNGARLTRLAVPSNVIFAGNSTRLHAVLHRRFCPKRVPHFYFRRHTGLAARAGSGLLSFYVGSSECLPPKHVRTSEGHSGAPFAAVASRRLSGISTERLGSVGGDGVCDSRPVRARDSVAQCLGPDVPLCQRLGGAAMGSATCSTLATVLTARWRLSIQIIQASTDLRWLSRAAQFHCPEGCLVPQKALSCGDPGRDLQC
jgi:hypothetical protein